MHAPTTTTISERALFMRLKRRLAREGLHLQSCRENSRWLNELGRYFATDENNALRESHIDLVGYGAELGLISANEASIQL